jgi:hypothetical protein
MLEGKSDRLAAASGAAVDADVGRGPQKLGLRTRLRRDQDRAELAGPDGLSSRGGSTTASPFHLSALTTKDGQTLSQGVRASAPRFRRSSRGRGALAIFADPGRDVILGNSKTRFAVDSPVEGDGFEPVWGFSCQVVFFGFCRFFVRSWKAVPRPVAYDRVRGARGRGQGTETLAQLGGLAALAMLVFRSALRPEHAERR